MASGLMVSKSHIREMVARAQSAIKSRDKIKERAEHVTETAVDTLVTGATGFGLGVMRGKLGGRVELFGTVPLELAVGVGSHLAGFAGLAGKSASRHLHSVGNGAIAAFAYGKGHDAGKAWRAKAGGGAPSRFVTADVQGGANGGNIEESGGGGLSDEALADLARRA